MLVLRDIKMEEYLGGAAAISRHFRSCPDSAPADRHSAPVPRSPPPWPPRRRPRGERCPDGIASLQT